jgi:hypothetical protein
MLIRPFPPNASAKRKFLLSVRLILNHALQRKGSACRCALALASGSPRLCAPGMLVSATMKIVELSPRENYGLFLRYEDGTEGVVDLFSMAGRGLCSVAGARSF